MDRCEERLHCQIRQFVEADRMALRLRYPNTRRLGLPLDGTPTSWCWPIDCTPLRMDWCW